MFLDVILEVSSQFFLIFPTLDCCKFAVLSSLFFWTSRRLDIGNVSECKSSRANCLKKCLNQRPLKPQVILHWAKKGATTEQNIASENYKTTTFLIFQIVLHNLILISLCIEALKKELIHSRFIVITGPTRLGYCSRKRKTLNFDCQNLI